MNAVKIAAIVLIVCGILDARVWQAQLYERDPRCQAAPGRALGEGQ